MAQRVMVTVDTAHQGQKTRRTTNSPYFLSGSFAASGFGSVIVKAIFLPSGDHSKPPTPSSTLVTAVASPPAGLIR